MIKTSPHNPLTSKDNSFIKKLRSLGDAKHRKAEQAFLIEGVKMVEEALRDDAGARTIIAVPDLVQHHGKGVLKLAESKSIEIAWISERLMDAVSESKTPQPVMAVVSIKQWRADDILSSPNGLIVLAHQLQDPGNLGTIIRTAEAAGASGIALAARTVDPYNAKSVRASMGSVLRVPIVQIDDTAAFLSACRNKSFQCIATDAHAEKTHFEIDLKTPSLLLFGQEGAGLPRDIEGGVDLRVRIPMAETIDSLNVATAAAVIIYEAVRQRAAT